MHLLIPHASALSEASAHTLRDLTLPNLARLMTMLQATTRDVDDEYTLSPPHERALATAHGWHGTDGRWPWAALQAAADGIDTGKRPWGLLTPVHWHVGREHITLADPSALDLPAEESRALFDAVRPLFEDDPDGGSLTWAAPTRWYLAHEHLADLPCACAATRRPLSINWRGFDGCAGCRTRCRCCCTSTRSTTPVKREARCQSTRSGSAAAAARRPPRPR
jgi:hypothetical protein